MGAPGLPAPALQAILPLLAQSCGVKDLRSATGQGFTYTFLSAQSSDPHFQLRVQSVVYIRTNTGTCIVFCGLEYRAIITYFADHTGPICGHWQRLQAAPHVL